MRSYWEEDLSILSSENVSFSVETAGLGSRLAAVTLDFTLQLIIALLVTLAYAGFDSYVWPMEKMPAWLTSSLMGLFYLGSFLLFVGYYFLFEWLWDGQTPGKRQMGLRVMMANGLPLTMWASLTRNIVRTVDWLPFCYGVGAIVAAASPLSQRAGDLVAGTIVARERRGEKQRKTLTINEAVEQFLAAATRVPGTSEFRPPLPEEEISIQTASRLDPEAAALALKLTREDYELARDFLARRHTLPAETASRLNRSLTQRLAARLEVVPPADGISWLEGIVAALARAYGQ